MTIRQIRINFICEGSICSGKSTAIWKQISAHKDNKFMVIVPTINKVEEFYTKLTQSIDKKSIRICVKDDAFKKNLKAVNDKVNIVITTY